MELEHNSPGILRVYHENVITINCDHRYRDIWSMNTQPDQGLSVCYDSTLFGICFTCFNIPPMANVIWGWGTIFMSQLID